MTSTPSAIAGVALLVALALWAPWFAWPAIRWAWRWGTLWPLGPYPVRLLESRLCLRRRPAMTCAGFDSRGAVKVRDVSHLIECHRPAGHDSPIHIDAAGRWWV